MTRGMHLKPSLKTLTSYILPPPQNRYLPKNCLGGGEIKKQKQDFPSHFYGDCGKHKLPSCGFPNGNFETLPADWDCGNMRCFAPRKSEMSGFEDKAEEDRF